MAAGLFDFDERIGSLFRLDEVSTAGDDRRRKRNARPADSAVNNTITLRYEPETDVGSEYVGATTSASIETCKRRTLSEWAPSILVRMLILNLGYTVGNNVYDSPNGIAIIAFIFVAALANEFFYQCTKILYNTALDIAQHKLKHTNNADKISCIARDRTMYDRVYDRLERIFVLLRHFTMGAIGCFVNKAISRSFSGVGDVSTAILMFIIILGMTDVMDELISYKKN